MIIIKDVNIGYGLPASIALGTFDGVHIGHCAVIKTAVEIARAEGLSPAVFTFSELPKNAFLPPQKRVFPLCSFEEKARLIAELGVELLLAPPFSEELRALPAERFVEDVLIRRLNAKHIVCGYDHRFGAGGMGDAELLMRVCRENGAAVTVIPPVSIDGERVSSTAIREAIREGRVDRAELMLGRKLTAITDHGDGPLDR